MTKSNGLVWRGRNKNKNTTQEMRIKDYGSSHEASAPGSVASLMPLDFVVHSGGHSESMEVSINNCCLVHANNIHVVHGTCTVHAVQRYAQRPMSL